MYININFSRISSSSSALSHPACTAAVFNLSAPLVFQEQDNTFTATIALVSPIGGSTFPIEIDIMETEITATPFC